VSENGRPTARRFEDLEVWQSAHRLVLDIYRVTARFPADEKFCLVSQMRRAAVSVPANIAEGFRRRTRRDKAHFYNMAQGSLEELRYYLILGRDLNFTPSGNSMSIDLDRVARMLHALTVAVLPSA
jgi:four helix bundle protein